MRTTAVCQTCGSSISYRRNTKKILKKIEILGEVYIFHSDVTKMYYVSQLHVEIGNGYLLEGVAEHKSTPEEAITAYFHRLTHLKPNETIIVDACGVNRKEYLYIKKRFTEILPKR